MAFNAAEFRSKLQYGGQRPNLFKITLDIPDSASGTQEITFMAQATNTPGFNLGSVDLPYFGRRVSFAGDRSFEDWSIVIIDDEDHPVRNALEAWQNRLALIDHNTNQLEAPNGLALYSNASVIQYSKTGEETKRYELKNAFPIAIEPTQLNWEADNQVISFGCTVRYDYFITDKIERLRSAV